jgi:hypothetical protein
LCEFISSNWALGDTVQDALVERLGGGGGWVGRLLIRLSGATVKMLICVLCELFFEVCTPAVCRTEGW